MQANYFFIDGSALTVQIRKLWREEPGLRLRRLDPRKLIAHCIDNLGDLHEGSWKRAIFYFPQGDETAIEAFLLVPDHRIPGELRDIHFKFCGHKLKKSAAFEKFVEESVPTEFQSRFSKSEKGIDIEMCCDALKLASSARLERLFLLTNDSDFIPLCRTIKDFGANVSIIHLSRHVVPNGDLLQAADTYDVVRDEYLNDLFLPAPDVLTNPVSGATTVAADSDKPEADPSDLQLGDAHALDLPK